MVHENHALYRLEKKRGTFLAIGFMLSLLVVLTAMEWRTEVIPIEPPELEPMDTSGIGPSIVIVYQIKKVKTEKDEEEWKKPDVDGEGPVQDDDLKKKDDFSEVDSVKWNEEGEDFGNEFIPQPPLDWSQTPPRFRNGDHITYLKKRITFHRRDIDSGISGKVQVSFIVSAKGELQQIKIVRGIGGKCDEEVLRAVRNMPRWKPGRMGKKKVAVRTGLIFEFKVE